MLYLLFLAGLLIYFGITSPDDATTIDRWDRPDRAPGVRVRRPRRPEGDL